MAATWRDSTSAVTSGSTLTVDPASPALTYVSGDVLVLHVWGYTSLGAPSGSDLTWTERLSDTQARGGDTLIHKVWTAVADAAITSFTIANGVADQIGYILTSVSDADTGSPVDAAGIDSALFSAVADPTAPSVSPTGTDSLLIAAAGVYPNADSASTFTPPSGMTEREDLESWDSYSSATLALSGSGATGTKVFTESPARSGSDEGWIASNIAIKSAPGGVPDIGAAGGGRRFFRPGRGPKPRWVRHWDNHEWLSAVEVSTGTNAPAEHAAATGTASSATVQIAPTAGHASATGAAGAATAKVAPSAGHAAATGAASSATITVAPTAGHAAATGAANTATTSVQVPAGHAAGTGTASSATAQVAPTSGHAAATGSASTATTTVAVPAGHAAATGAAHQATVATGTFAAAGHAAATGAAHNATPAVAPIAGVAAATGTASPVTAKISPTVGVATGTGAASSATAKVAPTAGHAAGTGTAHDATVVTGSFTFANAGNAAATGTANPATAKIAPTAGAASGSGQAFDATVSTATFTNAPAGHAAATGTAHTPTVAVRASAGHAAGVAIAAAATASIKPSAGHAAGTGTAWQPTVISGLVILTLLRVLHIRAEDRTLTVTLEDRTLTVRAEDRTDRVPAVVRDLILVGADRTLTAEAP